MILQIKKVKTTIYLLRKSKIKNLVKKKNHRRTTEKSKFENKKIMKNTINKTSEFIGNLETYFF